MSGATTSRYLQLRPTNIGPNQTISFKNGFPVLTFSIQSQNGILDPRTIRINGDLSVFSDNLPNPTAVTSAGVGGVKVTMDNRLGIYAMWDQLVIRHGKSKQICENIQHYNKYMSTYLGMTSSKQDLMGHLNETALIQPNPESMFENVVVGANKKSFSCHLPSGFLQSGNAINLMDNSFGGFDIEIHLSPDSNCLFTRDGVVTGVEDAHYQLSNLNLSCEVHDIPADQMATMSAQTSGALEFNSISSLYTSINTNNAQLQFNLGLKKLQSVFMTFVPSNFINTLAENGLANVYPSQSTGARTLVNFSRVQWLRGGSKYPAEFDMEGNTTIPGNSNITTANGKGEFVVSDSQLAKQFAQAVIPEFMLDRTSLSNRNLNRDFANIAAGAGTGASYKDVTEGGSLFGLGIRYSQYNNGQDFSSQQWGCSLDSDLTTDSPQSVFLFFKNRQVLAWSPNGIEIMR